MYLRQQNKVYAPYQKLAEETVPERRMITKGDVMSEVNISYVQS